jgi:hypothetical protein
MADPPAHASLPSSKLRIILLKLGAVAAGLVIGIGIVAVVGYWILTLQKP